MSKIDDVEKHAEQPTLERRGTDDVVYEPPKMGYRHPVFQIVLVSLVCFTCPGMFNALNGLGGGGQIDSQTNSRGTTALYSTFAVMSFFGGSIVNKLGPRPSLTFGTLGYTLYIASLLSYNINHDGKFNIAAGAILGVCAGVLWTAQGVLMLAYSTEATKGRYIAIFWAIFNLGAVVGATVPLAQQINQVEDRAVKNSVYIAFVVLTAFGCALTFALSKPSLIKRADGSPAVVPVNVSWRTEILNVPRVLVEDPFLIMLFPFFAASNYFYTWQFSFFNLVLFNPRTRALNNLLYWTSQIIGAGLMGVFLDSKMPRRKRGLIGWGIVTVIIVATWGGNWAMQKGLTRDDAKPESTHHKMDWTESGYGGPCFLYIMNGITDAAWQTYSYWVIGALTNNARKIAVLVGIYKGLQSALAAVGWAIDSEKVEFVNMYGSTFGLLGLGLLTALPVIYTRVTDHTDAATDELGGIDALGHVAGEHHSNHSDEKA